MRAVLTRTLFAYAGQTDFAFLTGDVGFAALEPLRDRAGARFINAGIAEQNMVSVAAGLASAGLKPWVYAIAPFLYARAFEQIRNDVCFHDLPVFLVGNGGGYAYGVMGPTHHALEDYGVLLSLPHLKAYVPAFDEDVPEAVTRLVARSRPAYLRLGHDEKPKGFALPAYAPWRRILSGPSATIVVLGPLAGSILSAALSVPESERPSLWAVSELPLLGLPRELVQDFQKSGHLIVVEEHVEQGSVGSSLAQALLSAGVAPRRFSHRFARGYPSGTYGSQTYHRKESGLDASSILGLARTLQ